MPSTLIQFQIVCEMHEPDHLIRPRGGATNRPAGTPAATYTWQH